MHFLQAIKMASKSLWSNKLRSFLTMLGIIIGVVTVSLLTSVAQGVSDVIVSSIRTQSTLAVLMNMNNNLTISGANSIIKTSQPEDKEADDYFEYSLIYSTNTIVANESLDIVSQDGIENYFSIKKQYTMQDFPNYDSMSDEEKALVSLLIQQSKKPIILKTKINGIDSNFKNVYDLEIDGKYPEKSNEILVDGEFIKTYLGSEVTNEDAKTRSVTFGIETYTKINLSMETLNFDYIKAISDYFNSKVEDNLFKVEVGSGRVLEIKIIKNENGNLYTIDDNSVYINIEPISTLTNEDLKIVVENIIKTALELESLEEEGINVIISDIYDTFKAKTYNIVGIISDNSASLISNISNNMSNSSSNKNTNSSVLMTYMSSLSSTSGTCYMLYDEENATTFGEKSVDYSPISYAYFRYKSESVMSSSTTNLVLAFSSAGYTYLSDFMLISFSSVASIMSNVMNVLTIMLTVISVISLIVGGIGIMNIMLVAVTERTREIGIRKAIGAKKSSILVQFLVEALMLSLIGGLIGLGISWIGILIISNVMEVSLTIPLWVIGMSVGFCTAIGLIFGMFPAVKASNMQPIDALRRE